MLAALFDLTQLRPALSSEDLIITANDRLRRHIVRAWDVERQAQGLNAWQAPKILPLNRWLERQWQFLVERGYPGCRAVIASRHQRQLLWERIIAQSPSGSGLLQAEPLARQAETALRSLELWAIDLDSLSETGPFAEPNSRAFADWLTQFREQMHQAGLITPETAHRILLKAFAEGALVRPERIWLEGFDDLPPLHRKILEAATDELIMLPVNKMESPSLIRTQAPDSETEIRTAALWSLEQLSKDPNAVIGIIVPDLGQRRAQVERLFCEVFEPLAERPENARYTLPFNFSAGVPLASTALVHSALSLLRLGLDQMPLEPLCSLVHSPFWSEPETELVLRTQLCERLRRLGKMTITGSDWRYLSQSLSEQLALTGPENLAERLQQFDQHRRRLPRNTAASDWAEAFRQQLALLGWPGPRRLDSQEYQQLGQWYELLESFAELDATGLSLTLADALKQLNQLAQQAPFQAQTPDSPIQILGILEGAGLRFSHCWVLGLHHRQWPPVPEPNPLLPLDLQRREQMPHASAERELHFARSLTDNYRHSATQIIFSSPGSDDQGDLTPSPLIRALPETPLDDLLQGSQSAHQRHSQRLADARRLEALNCSQGPQVNISAPAPGGSSLFKHQAACPFNAFAQLRLGAREPDLPALGLSPAERGTLLHNALASLWKELKTSAALVALEESELSERIKQACQQALEPVRKRRPRELGPEYCALELERLEDLIQRWLSLEKVRPPFTVVATEQRQEIDYAGLKLTLYIDRIDELENGERLLIDYKTGADLKTTQWLGERPDEPQLPLYAVTQSEQIKGLAFAQLNPKALQWIGLGELNSPLPGLKPPQENWQTQLQEWDSVLSTLARDFIAGDARVDFKDAGAQRFSEALLPLNRALEADLIQDFLRLEKH